jgi:hypothetical protein
MASYQKFNAFVENQLVAKIDWDADVFKIMLTNVAPLATNSVKADLTEIAAGSGYSAGGAAVTISVTRSGGTVKVTGADVVFTSSGSIGPFKYAVLYNDTVASPAKPLVAWWEYPGNVTLLTGETFTVDFDATNGIFQLT